MLDPGTVDISQMLATLGRSLLNPLTVPPSRPVPVSTVMILERRAALPPVNDAILLAVGLDTAHEQAGELILSAARAGYACVVVKTFGEPVAELVAVAQRAGIVLLAADEAVAWHHLDALISSALAATVRFPRLAGTPTVGELFPLANAIAGMVGGATVIEDPHQRILAYSTVAGQPIDECRRQGILGLRVPDCPEHDQRNRELVRQGGVCRFPALPCGLARLGVAVFAGGEWLGSVWVVDADNRVDPTAEQALAEVTDIVSSHLLAARTSIDTIGHVRANLLRKLFADPGGAAILAPRLGLDPTLPVAVAAFTPAPGDTDDVHTAHAATRLADLVNLHYESHYGRHGCALIDGTVYALLPGGASPGAHRELLTTITRRAHSALRLPVHAGLGSLVPGLPSIAESRADADLVLDALADRPGEPRTCRVATIDEAWAGATLSALARHNTLPRTPGPAVHAHDRAHGTTYAATILAYLDANGEITVASQQLRVHPNTIRYRLARAGEIFGFDLADPDQRLVLWLRLRLSTPAGR